MTWTPLAISLTHTFTEIGALVAVAGFVGIAVVSLLLFSQGREIKRLREWAGRAPERAVEREQRTSSPAAATPAAAGQGAGSAAPLPAAQSRVAGVRPVPRTTPLITRATAAAAATAQQPPPAVGAETAKPAAAPAPDP